MCPFYHSSEPHCYIALNSLGVTLQLKNAIPLWNSLKSPYLRFSYSCMNMFVNYVHASIVSHSPKHIARHHVSFVETAELELSLVSYEHKLLSRKSWDKWQHKTWFHPWGYCGTHCQSNTGATTWLFLLLLLSWLTPLPYRRGSSLFPKAHRAAPHCTLCSHLQYLCFICSDIWGKVETVEPQIGSARITSCKHKYT